jgi:hypothetical protein
MIVRSSLDIFSLNAQPDFNLLAVMDFPLAVTVSPSQNDFSNYQLGQKN